MTRERLAALLGVALLVAGLVLVLSRSEQRLATSNTEVIVSPAAFVLPPGHRACERDQFVPSAAKQVRLYAGTRGSAGPPFDLEFRDGERRVVTAVARGGYRDGPLTLALPVRSLDLEATVCVHNRGRTAVQFGVATVYGGGSAAAAGRIPATFRLDFLRRGRESGWDIAPQVAGRAGFMKSRVFGGWTLWVLAGATALLGYAATRIVSRGRTEA